MHTFMRAIGLSNVNSRKDFEKLIGDVMTSPTDKCVHNIKGKERFVEISKDYANDIGITIRGYYDEKGFFHLEHYFPYVKPLALSVSEKIYVNKKIDNTAYSVLCDKMQFGVALVFYLINAVDFLNIEDASRYYIKDTNVYLSALCKEGKVILPVMQNEKMKTRCKKMNQRKQQLLLEAQNGNQAAIDNLTINDIDMNEKINKRTKKEDIYTIVDNSFYPCGTESDKYSMVGTITDIFELKNEFSKEEIYKFIIECNNVMFSVCINKSDLLGIPSVGARFKGDIWLQGKVEF